MKLSDAIRLGSTLIGETRKAYYLSTTNCGCAIGAARAAVEDVLGVPTQESNWTPWLKRRWPWTAADSTKELDTSLGLDPVGPIMRSSVAEAISLAHYRGMPRLQIADIIARFEPEEVEQGVEGRDHAAEVDALVAAGVARRGIGDPA